MNKNIRAGAVCWYILLACHRIFFGPKQVPYLLRLSYSLGFSVHAREASLLNSLTRTKVVSAPVYCQVHPVRSLYMAIKISEQFGDGNSPRFHLRPLPRWRKPEDTFGHWEQSL